jgi:cyclopropane fatty-acyl-phospholipid synthase-like methyltransferase
MTQAQTTRRTKPVTIVGKVKTRIARLTHRIAFTGSTEYWERRYANGGHSGAGSYGPMAEWKAHHINEWVQQHNIQRVIEFGCGDGAQLSHANYPHYIGLDVSRTVIDTCKQKYADDPTKSFLWMDPDRFINNRYITGDLVLSLDVILHLVEDERLTQHVQAIDAAGTRYAIFVTEDRKTSPGDPHVRYRNLADWKSMMPGWRWVKTIENPWKDGHPSDADMFIFERVDGLGAVDAVRG